MQLLLIAIIVRKVMSAFICQFFSVQLVLQSSSASFIVSKAK